MRQWYLPALFGMFGACQNWPRDYDKNQLAPITTITDAVTVYDFDDIRPYHDNEVRPTLDRVLDDREFQNVIARLGAPKLSRYFKRLIAWLMNRRMRREVQGVNSVRDFQDLIEKYMGNMLQRTTTGLSSSGIDKLDMKKAYLFVSNHRDISMDSAFVNWELYHHGGDTVRIAFGDNLLTKPYATDVMRLNKCFIVNRSATGKREKFAALKKLSAYIRHSITGDREHCWIAQREGRAKDGNDRTNATIIKMFAMSQSKEQSFAEGMRELNIVPVSISYEWDPCDGDKARELHSIATTGEYKKGEHEDVESIGRGISGIKGHVHVAFGDVLMAEFADADEMAAEIDRQVIHNYVLQPSNFAAYYALHQQWPGLPVTEEALPFDEKKFAEKIEAYRQRVDALAPELRPYVHAMYANPIQSKLDFAS